MNRTKGHGDRTRRGFLRTAAVGCAAAALPNAWGVDAARRIELILAPSSLGLRPDAGVEPGAWRAPEVLMAAGLETRLGAARVVALPHPRYRIEAEAGTRIRNGHAIRAFSLEIAGAARAALERGAIPLVIGGDCSVLLGALYGARLAGARGLVHVDGHSDFFHPGNYDTASRLGSVAGMDLALATGRGEDLLARWPDIDGPLVADDDAVQAGERDELAPGQYYGDILGTRITRWSMQRIAAIGLETAARELVTRLAARALSRVWLHIDLDVLDEKTMPAVDSPGSPGFTFERLAEFLAALHGSGRIVGATVTIYDPERDPGARHAPSIVALLARVFRAA